MKESNNIEIEQKQSRARKALPKIKALKNSSYNSKIGGQATNFQTEQTCRTLCQTLVGCGTGH